MISFPCGKINLGLNVTGRRADGFHDIETLFYPIPLHDVLEIVPQPDGETRFASSGLPVPGIPSENLCVRAFTLMQQRYGVPAVSIHLHKAIPMGSGLGGGSSDAAYVLRMTRDLFTPGIPDEELEELAGMLGSDCPFFIRSVPSFASGRGELLDPAPVSLAGYYLVLLIPPLHIATAEAYRLIRPQKPGVLIREIVEQPVENWRALLTNDFVTTGL